MLSSLQVGILSLLLTGFAEPSEPTEAPSATKTANEVADDLSAVANIALAEHYSPPTKQEMIAAAIRALNRTEKLDAVNRIIADSRIANAVSAAASDADLRSLLLAAVTAAQSDSTNSDLSAVGAHAILAVLPGGGMFTPHKDHLVEEQLAANRYVGVGISLRADDGKTIIQAVIPDGPCHRAGISADSRIIRVDDWDVGDHDLGEVVQQLRGPEGSDVTLTIQPPSSTESVEYQLTRGVVPFKHVQAYSTGPNDRKIGVARIGRLTPSVPHELRAFAAQSPDLVGVIIDLSTTQPGSAHDAILAADVLMDAGEAGTAISIKGARKIELQPDAVFKDLPMCVVVGPQTTGTTEWLAAALVESGRGTLIGEPTAGAAIARESFPLPGERYVVDLATTVLVPKSNERLMASLDVRSMQHLMQEVGFQLKNSEGPKPGGVRNGRLVPPEGSIYKIQPVAVPIGVEKAESRPVEYLDRALDHFLKHLLNRPTSTDTDERQ